jgi:hypothetical protein
MKWVGGISLCRAATLLWQDADALQRLLQESPATFQHVSSQNEAAEAALPASNADGLNMFSPTWSRTSMSTAPTAGISALGSQPAALPAFLGSLPRAAPLQASPSLNALQQLVAQSAAGPAGQPATQPAAQSFIQTAPQPALQLGLRPAMQPPMQPAMELAMEPATQPAMQPDTQPAMQFAMQQAVVPAGRSGMQQDKQQAVQWFTPPQTPPQAMATPLLQTGVTPLVTPVNHGPSPSVGMLPPYEHEEVKPVFVQSAPSPGDDGRFDESDRVKAFIQGLRGSPAGAAGSAFAAAGSPAAPVSELQPAPTARLAPRGPAMAWAPAPGVAAAPPMDLLANARGAGLSRWMDYFSSQNDSVRAREQR